MGHLSTLGRRASIFFKPLTTYKIPMSFRKILVAIDNSPLCHSVFAAALELAQPSKADNHAASLPYHRDGGEPMVSHDDGCGFASGGLSTMTTKLNKS
jgi:hypothetical protein